VTPHVALDDVLDEARPGFACGAVDPNGVVQVRMNNIFDGSLVFDSIRRVPSSVADLTRFGVATGDVLFNATNSPELVGKSALFRGYPEPVVYSNHFLRLRPKQGALEGAYLSRWLHMLWTRGDFSHMCRQWVNQATVASDRLLSLEIPLPPLPAQRRIAAILDKADELRAKRRAALAQLDGLAQSVFVEMFGDPATNPRNLRRLSLVEIATQVTDGEHITPKRASEGIKLLSARNVQDGYLDFSDVDHVGMEEFERISKRCRPELGDILISCSGTIGRVAVVETTEPLALVRSAALVKLRRDMVAAKYVEHYLRTPYMRSQMLRRANVSSQANLFQGQIRGLCLLIPDRVDQDRFSERVTKIAAVKTSQAVSGSWLDVLFASLQDFAFRGEL
jgi:hypothetical protein